MIQHTARYTPEGMREVHERLLTVLTENIGEKPWAFVASDNDADIPRVTSTIGANRNDMPDILLGISLYAEAQETMTYLVEDLYAYFEATDQIHNGQIDMEVFYNFRKAHRKEQFIGPDVYVPGPRFYLQMVDAERFLDGIGYHHRSYYADQDVGELVFLQLIPSDESGLYPWDKGYDFVQQYMHETKPWRKAEKNHSHPLHAERMKYLH